MKGTTKEKDTYQILLKKSKRESYKEKNYNSNIGPRQAQSDKQKISKNSYSSYNKNIKQSFDSYASFNQKKNVSKFNDCLDKSNNEIEKNIKEISGSVSFNEPFEYLLEIYVIYC